MYPACGQLSLIMPSYYLGLARQWRAGPHASFQLQWPESGLVATILFPLGRP